MVTAMLLANSIDVNQLSPGAADKFVTSKLLLVKAQQCFAIQAVA